MADELVLVVEDNAVSRELVCDLLTFHGYRTIEAGMAEEGVRLAAERRPDLIVMDVLLPGMDGVSALGRLRSRAGTAGIPVVALTPSR